MRAVQIAFMALIVVSTISLVSLFHPRPVDPMVYRDVSVVAAWVSLNSSTVDDVYRNAKSVNVTVPPLPDQPTSVALVWVNDTPVFVTLGWSP